MVHWLDMMFWCRMSMEWTKGKLRRCKYLPLEAFHNQIHVWFPHLLSDHEMQKHLRDRLFYGVHKTLRESIRYVWWSKYFLHSAISCFSESWNRSVRGKMVTATTNIKAKVAASQTGDNDELENLHQQVANLVTVVNPTQFNSNGNKKGQPGNHSSRSNGSQANAATGPLAPRVNINGPQPSAAGPYHGDQRPTQCYKCRGKGHVWWQCPTPTPLNWSRGKPRSKSFPETTGKSRKETV